MLLQCYWHRRVIEEPQQQQNNNTLLAHMMNCGGVSFL